jgi:hypothetical protein
MESSRRAVQAWIKRVIESRKKVMRVFYFCIAVIVGSGCIVIQAQFSFNEGLGILSDVLNFLDGTFDVLASEGDNLALSADSISVKTNRSVCEYAYEVSDYLVYYSDAVDEYQRYVDPVASPVSDTQEYASEWGEFKTQMIWIVFAYSVLAVPFYVLAVCRRSKVTMNAATFLGELGLFVLLCAGTIWFVVLVSLMYS